jgi:hypothetical protein
MDFQQLTVLGRFSVCSTILHFKNNVRKLLFISLQQVLSSYATLLVWILSKIKNRLETYMPN